MFTRCWSPDLFFLPRPDFKLPTPPFVTRDFCFAWSFCLSLRLLKANNPKHGVKRTGSSARDEVGDRKALDAYLQLEQAFFGVKAAGTKTEEALAITTSLLSDNPELYTCWNYRREILLSLKDDKGTLYFQQQLEKDIALTMSLLKRLPKVYWIWNHRRWCLETLTNTFEDSEKDGKKWEWNKELLGVSKLLQADSRNFHAWEYRRHVLLSLASDDTSQTKQPFPQQLSLAMLEEEKEYTGSKIAANFSNFSAWHQRSKILPCLCRAQNIEQGSRAWSAVRDQDFELVKQALYTEPLDQSAWLYHRWLISLTKNGGDDCVLRREIQVIEELMELEPESKWCLDTLVSYYTLLGKSAEPGIDEQDCKTKICSCLQKLLEIDPDRRGRYQDLLNQAS